MPLGSKLTMPPGSQFYIELYKENCKRLLLLNRLWEFDETKQEWSLGGPLHKFFKLVLICWISRSRGQKISFQNEIFKNLLVLNYKAQGFHIWYIASS